jgi:hypothetical protein
VIHPPTFSKVFDWKESVAVVVQDEACGLIDSKGNWLVHPKYRAIYDAKDGYLAFDGEKGSGFLNLKGEVVIGEEFFVQTDPRGEKTEKKISKEAQDFLLFQMDSEGNDIFWADTGVANFFYFQEGFGGARFRQRSFYLGLQLKGETVNLEEVSDEIIFNNFDRINVFSSLWPRGCSGNC